MVKHRVRTVGLANTRHRRAGQAVSAVPWAGIKIQTDRQGARGVQKVIIDLKQVTVLALPVQRVSMQTRQYEYPVKHAAQVSIKIKMLGQLQVNVIIVLLANIKVNRENRPVHPAVISKVVIAGELALTERQRKRAATLIIKSLQVTTTCSGQVVVRMIVDTTVGEQDLPAAGTVINGDEHAGQAIQTTAIRWRGGTVIDVTAGRDTTQDITV